MPPVTSYLIGDGAMGTPGNWKTAELCPLAGDTAIVGYLCGSDATDAGAVVDVDLAAWEIHRTYTHSFGTSAAPIGVAAAIIKLYSSGPVYMQCANTLNVDRCIVAMARPDVVCELGSEAAGEWIDIWVDRGKCTLKANIDLTAARVHVGYVSNPASDANLTIATSAPTLPNLIMDGGFCKAANVITDVAIRNATLVKTTAKITTGYIYTGGVLNYEYASVAADNTTLHVFSGGMLDLLTNEIPKDIDNVFVHPGGNIRYDPTLHTFSGTYGLVFMKNEVLP